MAKTFIFAIGGTGARVLRSLTMLMASGVKGMEEDICPIIIDYDLHNGDKNRAITCMKKYSEIQKLVAEGESNTDSKIISAYLENHVGYRPYFTTKIDCLEGISDWCWQFNVRKELENLKYKEYISYDEINQCSIATQDFVNCLYDTDNNSVYTELNLNMREGFQGNPNIGSVVFDGLKECPEFKVFENNFRDGDRIVIIGSVFGGTGSSGIPKIISAIRNNAKTSIQKANLSVVLVLPYFSVNAPTEKEISIKSNIFNSKTKAALNYYESSGINKQINSIYYVGDKVPTKVEPHIGNKLQKNKAHIVELISAMSVVHFITSVPQPKNMQFKFSAAQHSTDGIGIKDLIGNPNNWEKNKFVRDILHNMVNFVYSARYFLDNIVSSPVRMKERQFYQELKLNFENKKVRSSNNESIIRDYCAALYDFLCKKDDLNDEDDGFWPWMNELHDMVHGAHRLRMFNLDKENIVDILSEYCFRSDPVEFKSIKFKSEKPLMEYDDQFDTALNDYLFPYRKGQKKLEEEDPKAYPYIFNDILTKMPEDLRGNAKLKERFKLVP